MKNERLSECPDCQSPMEVIKLLDATDKNFGAQQGAHYVEMRYAAGDGKPGFLRGGLAPIGTVEARMCTGCGRILLYGERSP